MSTTTDAPKAPEASTSQTPTLSSSSSSSLPPAVFAPNKTPSTNVSSLSGPCASSTPSTFELFDWTPTPTLTVDENFMDVTILLMRTSKCLQGSMGCVIVSPLSEDLQITPDLLATYVLCLSVNSPMYTMNCSDVHAEINALSYCAKNGIATNNSTAYITMPPCKNCFVALVKAGVKRIVCRHKPLEEVNDICALEGIDVVDMRDDDAGGLRRMEFVRKSGRGCVDGVGLVEARKRRKQAARDFKVAKSIKKELKLGGGGGKVEGDQKDDDDNPK